MSPARSLIAIFLCLVLPSTQVQFEGPVKLTREQTAFLREEAKEIKRIRGEIRKQLKSLEKGPWQRPWWCFWCVPPTLTPPINRYTYSPTLKGGLISGVDRLANRVSTSRDEFLKRLTTEQQRDAAEVIFDEIAASYKPLEQDARQVDSSSYEEVRDRLDLVSESHYKMIEVMAKNQSETFELDVASVPAGADVYFKRGSGGDYKKHGDPTKTTIRNLAYASYTICAQLPGKEPQERPFDPAHQIPHVVFDLRTSSDSAKKCQ